MQVGCWVWMNAFSIYEVIANFAKVCFITKTVGTAATRMGRIVSMRTIDGHVVGKVKQTKYSLNPLFVSSVKRK